MDTISPLFLILILDLSLSEAAWIWKDDTQITKSEQPSISFLDVLGGSKSVQASNTSNTLHIFVVNSEKRHSEFSALFIQNNEL